MAFSGGSGGDGSESYPFQIANLTDLQSWDDNWNQASPNIKSSYFILTADIDASDTSTWNGGAGWIPIGTYTNPFRGNFNGQGHKISNLYINATTTQNYNGVAFLGNVYAGTITSITLSNVSIFLTLTDGTHNVKIAGIVGALANSVISNCSVSGEIGCNTLYSCYLGGVCASHSATATNCYSAANISATIANQSCICGGAFGANWGTISNCYATGNVSGVGGYRSDVGGFAGDITSGSATNCFSTGSVTANSEYQYIGPFTSLISYGASISNCIWNSDTSILTVNEEETVVENSHGTPLSTANMMLPASFTSWNFSTIWDMLFPTTAYPTLEVFGTNNTSHTITSATPNTGSTSGGESITVAGTGFLEGATEYLTGITIGGNACTDLVIVSNISATCKTPAGTVGSKNIVATFLDTGTSTKTNGFTYGNAITEVLPATGNVAGGTAVVITGTGFTGATGATFGGVSATSFVVVNDNTITCTTPAHAVGAVTVAVGSITKASAFTYTLTPDPIISSLDPTWGTTAGGTRVVITGHGFTNATGVTFDGIAAYSYEIVSDSKIVAFTPMNHKGVCDVVVIIP